MLRRLNDQFLSFVEEITLLHQYQREFDGNGRLVTTVEDLRHAAELFFNAIFLKIDDLDSGLRQFYEQMKRHVREHIPTNKFRQRDIRHALRYSKSHAHRFFQDLKQREYIRVVGGTANKGFVYEIDYFDDSEKMKQAIKNDLIKQIEELR
jgi:DNA primase